MTLQATLRPEAIDEFIDAAAWYETQRSGLGADFLSEFEWLVWRLCEFPDAGRPIGRRMRMARVRRFAYVVVYRRRERELRILAVLHIRRDASSRDEVQRRDV